MRVKELWSLETQRNRETERERERERERGQFSKEEILLVFE